MFFHPRRHPVDDRRVIGRAFANPGDAFVVGRIDALDLGGGGDLAERELLAFADFVADEITVFLRRDFRGHRHRVKIDIAARGVEIGQQLLVELDPAGIEGVGADEEAQDTGLFRADHPAQARIGEGAVAGEGDALDLGVLALDHLEHEVDAVLRAADDHRLHLRGDPALVGIGLGDRFGVLLGGGRVEHVARLGLQQREQLVVLQALVAFDVDPVDQRKLGDLYNQRRAARVDGDGFEQAGGDETLVGVVQFSRTHRLATSESQIGHHRVGLDRVEPFDLHRVEGIALRRRRCRQQRRSA